MAWEEKILCYSQSWVEVCLGKKDNKSIFFVLPTQKAFTKVGSWGLKNQ